MYSGIHTFKILMHTKKIIVFYSNKFQVINTFTKIITRIR